jgi:hypothetical protein
VNKLLNYLSITDAKNVVLKKDNICTTLHFISVLITAIGYYGDQNDGENISNTSEVVRNSFVLYREKKFFLFFILAMLYSS